MILSEVYPAMEVTLEVRERVVHKTAYHRLNIPKRLSRQLDLEKGDRLRLKILEITKSETSDDKGVSKRPS